MPSERYDVVVVGGGPAGSVTAGLTAGRGYRVLLLDRGAHPQPLPGGAERTPLDAARAGGAEIRGGCAAVNVVTEDERVTGLRHHPHEGPARTVRARYVVDASGGRSVLRRHVTGDRAPAGLAVHACFRTGALGEGPRRFPFRDGWLRTEPAGPGLVRLTAVVPWELADRVHADPESALSAFVAGCPPVREYLAEATRVPDGGPARIRVHPHRPDTDRPLWRPGMLLVGDAAYAVRSPLTPGDHLARRGAELAAHALDDCLSGTTEEDTAFTAYERHYREAYRAALDAGAGSGAGVSP